MISKLFHSGPSLEALHEEYAKKGRIDHRASVTAEYDVEIAASAAQVWEILARPANWHRALPAIHDVHLDSGVHADATFTWKNGSAKMKSRFAVVRPEAELTWTGTSMGFKAVHRHTLRPLDDSRTGLHIEESMSGPLLTLFFPPAKLHTAISTWAEGIKNAAERSHSFPTTTRKSTTR